MKAKGKRVREKKCSLAVFGPATKLFANSNSRPHFHSVQAHQIDLSSHRRPKTEVKMPAPMSILQLQKVLVVKLQDKFSLNVRGLKSAFALYDTDGNGLLDLDEMQKGIGMILNGVQDEDVRALVNAYDLNGDGKLSYEEFLGILQNPRLLEEASRNAPKPPQPVMHKGKEYQVPPKKNKVASTNAEYDVYGNDTRLAQRNAAERFPPAPPAAAAVAPGSRANACRPTSVQTSVFSFNDDAYSVAESNIDLSHPAELEARARAYLNSLRTFLHEQSIVLRQQGKVGEMSERLSHNASDLLNSVSRAILRKTFQPFTGSDDGRTRAAEDRFVDLPDFTKVLRSFRIPGNTGAAALRVEVIHFLFSLCHPDTNDEDASLGVADPEILGTLLFGAGAPSPRQQVSMKMARKKNIAAGVSTEASDDAAEVMGLSMVEKAQRGKKLIATGPVKRASGKDQHANEVPLRFTSRRSRTTFAVPANFDSVEGQARSSREPSHDLSRSHVHGFSCKMNSGNALLSLPSSACANPNGQRNDPDYLDDSVVVYASAALGVVHDLSNNTQKLFSGHKNDITCIALSNCKRYVATGSSGAKKSCIHVWESRPSNQFGYTGESPESLATFGEGFFDRAVCSVAFLEDPNYVCGIGCDDAHTLGIWDIRDPSKKHLVMQTTQNGIPPQIKCMQFAQHQEYTEYISNSQKGLCDVGCTAGEHHLRLWSFKRPVTNELGTQQVAQLSSRGAIFGTDMSKQVQAPKVYTCVDFSMCADKTSDIITGGSNGVVYLFRKGKCIAFQNAIKGGVRCLQVSGDLVCCGGKSGGIVCLNVRTLAINQAFRAAYPPPQVRTIGGSVQASGRAVSSVARPLSAASKTSAVDLGSDGDLGDVVGLTVISTARGTHAVVASTCGRTMVVDLSRAGASTPTPRARSAGEGGAPSLPSPGVNTLFYFHTGELWGLANGQASVHHGNSQLYRKVSLLATVGDDRRMIVWDPAKRCTVARTSLAAAARCVSFNAGCEFLVVGTQSGSVHVYAMVPGREDASVTPRPSGKGNAISASTRLAREQTEHRRSKKYSLAEVSFRRDFREPVTDVAFSPDNCKIAAGSSDDSICIYGCDMNVDKQSAKCSMQPLHRLRGHSSYITHLDWSKDGQLLRSTCGAYELLYWNVEAGKQHLATTADTSFQSEHCPLGFPVMGIWPAYSDGTDINAVDVSSTEDHGKLIVTGDDSALVNLMNYPCIVKHAPRKEYTGHGSHVTNVRFFRTYSFRESEGDSQVATIGGRDSTLITWAVAATPVSPPVRKYIHKLN